MKINNIIFKRNNNLNSLNDNLLNKMTAKNSINFNNNVNNKINYNDKIIVPQVKIKKNNKDDNCIIF